MTTGAGKAIRRAFRTHPALVFIFCAFAWSWTWILLGALTRTGHLGLPMQGDLGVLLARFGPSLAALGCLGFGQGPPAVGRLLDRLGETRVGARWVLLLLGSDIAFYVLVFLVGSLLDPRLPQVDGPLLASLPGTWIPAFLASMVTSGIGEELGWRGLLLPLFLRRMSPLRATLAMVPIISLWHLNMAFVTQGLREGLPAFLSVYLPAMTGRLALTLPSLCVFTLAFCRNRGSLLLMVVGHAAINASYEWADHCVGASKPTLFWGLYGGLLWALGIWAALQLRRMPKDLEVDPAYRSSSNSPLT